MIGFLLILGWISAIIIGLGIAGMAFHVGNTYVFTSAGVSRMGPKVGQFIGNLPVTSGGNTIKITQLASNSPYTLLIFFNVFGDNTLDLLFDLDHFAHLTSDTCNIVAFCSGESRMINTSVQRNLQQHPQLVLYEINDEKNGFDLQNELKIRVNPFAVLIDRNALVVSKGLVNGMPHFCFLMTEVFRNTIDSQNREMLKDIAMACNPHLPEEMRVAQIDYLAD